MKIRASTSFPAGMPLFPAGTAGTPLKTWVVCRVVFLNGEKLGFVPSRILIPGDHIRLGAIRLIYDQIPDVVLRSFSNHNIRHTLTVTATAQKIILPPGKSAVIGRGDNQVGFAPDIDLQSFGELSRRVSRRHARIQWESSRPYVEDMGSGFGTRLRGGVLPLGELVPLVPGDHIWLAGCVLAYDVEVPTSANMIKLDELSLETHSS